MKSKQWFISFIVLTFLAILCVVIFNLVINPFRTYNTSLSIDFISDRNGRYSKLVKLNKKENINSIERLIVGSSRSEYFFPEDMNVPSFSSSMGGAMTYTKYGFAQEGIKSLKKLKEIWYVSDFYEFNQKKIPWQLSDLKSFQDYFQKSDFDQVRPSIWQKIKGLISVPTLSASFKTLKELKKGKKIIYLDNGRTTTPITQRSFNELDKQVKKVFQQYVKKEWKNYEQISELSKSMIRQINQVSKNKGIKIVYILTPLHSYFMNYIKNHSKLSKLWLEWKNYMYSLKSRNIRIVDLEKLKLFSDSSNYWQDGVHFNREASKKVIHFVENQ